MLTHIHHDACFMAFACHDRILCGTLSCVPITSVPRDLVRTPGWQPQQWLRDDIPQCNVLKDPGPHLNIKTVFPG